MQAFKPPYVVEFLIQNGTFDVTSEKVMAFFGGLVGG